MRDADDFWVGDTVRLPDGREGTVKYVFGVYPYRGDVVVDIGWEDDPELVAKADLEMVEMEY